LKPSLVGNWGGEEDKSNANSDEQIILKRKYPDRFGEGKGCNRAYE